MSKQTLTLPIAAQKLFEHYQNLQIQGLKVTCPYHINTGLYGKSRALVGKGRPEEIEAAAERYLTRFKMDARGDTERLKRYLMGCGIGIDCSGFAAWILNCVTEDQLKKPVYRCLTFPSAKRSLISKLRPFENISANLLTNAVNAMKITDMNQVQPGDLVRLINGAHVMIISEVAFNKQGKVEHLVYMQSTVGYGMRSGVESGKVRIKKPLGDLSEQDWEDPLIYEDLRRSGSDARIVRLKALL